MWQTTIIFSFLEFSFPGVNHLKFWSSFRGTYQELNPLRWLISLIFFLAISVLQPFPLTTLFCKWLAVGCLPHRTLWDTFHLSPPILFLSSMLPHSWIIPSFYWNLSWNCFLWKCAWDIIFLRLLALAGVAQWIEHWTVKQRVTGSIPSQGTCLGCRLGPQ